MSRVSQIRREGDLQELAGVVHHRTPQTREILAWLFAERVVLNPEMSNPAVDVSRGIVGVEVVEVVLGESLLGTLPHQAGHPGDKDVAEGVGIDGVNVGFVLGFVSLLGNTGLEVDIMEILGGGLELILGVRRADGHDGSSGGGGEAILSGRGGRFTWMGEKLSWKI